MAEKYNKNIKLTSLNPCCNGRGSKTLQQPARWCIQGRGLNPCCNGRGSKTNTMNAFENLNSYVLILVVMEEGQRLSANKSIITKDDLLS